MIYHNPKSYILEENIFNYCILEGVTMINNPSSEFYKTAEAVLENIHNKFKDREQEGGLFIKKGSIMSDNKNYMNSVDKSRENIKSGKNSIIIRFFITTMLVKINDRSVVEIIRESLKKEGFDFAPEGGSFLNMIATGNCYPMYKKVNNDLIIVAYPTLKYNSRLSTKITYTDCNIVFKACKPDEKTLKALKLNESFDIFNSINLI